MNESFEQQYLNDALATFSGYRKLAERALAQISDEELFETIDEESNSIAVVMKHLARNMISRWTDILTSDGEKPDRNRDLEFVIESQDTQADLFAYWEKGWECLLNALESLRPTDFERKALIRGEEHTIVQAVNRQMTHYAYHVGQIVFLAKHFRSKDWKSLSVPKNRSSSFNEYMQQRPRSAEHRFDVAAGFAAELESERKKD